jgi:hypothetical protein
MVLPMSTISYTNVCARKQILYVCLRYVVTFVYFSFSLMVMMMGMNEERKGRALNVRTTEGMYCIGFFSFI